MRVLLRNIQTGLYYAGEDQWTDNAALAWDFKQVEQAAHAYSEVQLADGEIVVEDGATLRLLHPPFAQPESVPRPA